MAQSNSNDFGSSWSSMAFSSIDLITGKNPGPVQSMASFTPLLPVQSCGYASNSSSGVQTGSPPTKSKSKSLKPCDIATMKISVPPPEQSFWANFLAQGWLGKLIKEKPPQQFTSVTLDPFGGAPVPPSRISGSIKLKSVTLQFVAPIEIAGSRKKEGLKISVELKPGPGFCAEHAHPLLSVDPPPRSYLGGMPMQSTSAFEFEVFAKAIVKSDITGLKTPFAFIGAAMSGADLSRTYRIFAETCGNRSQKEAIDSLFCHLTVFPEKVVTIKLTIPEMISKSRSISGKNTTTMLKGGGSMASSSLSIESENTQHLTSRDSRGVAKTSDKSSLTITNRTITDKNGGVVKVQQLDTSSEQQVNRAGGNYKTTKTSSDMTTSLPGTGASQNYEGTNQTSKNTTGYLGGIELSVEDDGVEIGGSFMGMLEAISTAKAVIDGVQKLSEWMNASVQVGWKVAGTFKALSGDLKLVWGIKQVESEAQVARYFGIEGRILVVESSASVSFGLCLAFTDLTDDADLLDARIIGTLTGAVNLKGSYESLTGVPAVGRKCALSGDVTLKIEGKVVVAKIINMNAEVTGGMNIEGKWLGDTDKKPEISISAGLKKIEAQCTIKTFFWNTQYGPATILGVTTPFFNLTL